MKKMNGCARWVLAAALGTGAFAAAALAPPQARACGGLFCSSAQPVNQAAERIVFSFDQTKKQVTAVVEILYSGPAEKFAWVLPVPGVPTVGVSTSAILDRLQAQTNPLYSINRSWQSDVCRGPTSGAGGFSGSPPANAGNSDGSPGVSVLASGSVGPYVYDVIMVSPDPAVTDKAMVALKWLTDNGYDVGGLGREVLQPYLRDGLNLIAFKLQKNQTAGSIRPVMLTYDSAHPMIPIVPTKVAANPDMGILVFVLGARRAVPINYKSLELNEALIDWFNPNTTYNAVVSAAADEAKGQGFVTELAQPTAMTVSSQTLYQEQFIVDEYRSKADGLDAADLLIHVIQQFSSFAQGGFMGPFASRPAGMRIALDGVTDVLGTHVKLPAGVTMEQFMARPTLLLHAAERRHGLLRGPTRPEPEPAHRPDGVRSDQVHARCGKADHQTHRGHRAAVRRAAVPDASLHHDEPGRDDAGPDVRPQYRPARCQQRPQHQHDVHDEELWRHHGRLDGGRWWLHGSWHRQCLAARPHRGQDALQPPHPADDVQPPAHGRGRQHDRHCQGARRPTARF